MAALKEPSVATPPHSRTKPTLTPPTSDEGNKRGGSPISELSDLDFDEDDIGPIEPDHFYEGGRIPVFKPTMKQFESFPKFIDKINVYGMKSGIVKVVPPKEWRDALPDLHQAVKSIKVKNPITQDISGAYGTYTQANIEKQRSYNLPQWKALTEEPQNQPPAKRGERRKYHDKPAKTASQKAKMEKSQTTSQPAPKRRRPGRPRKSGPQPPTHDEPNDSAEERDADVPPTPTSPVSAPKSSQKSKSTKSSAPRSRGSQAKSVAERRKYNRQETVEDIDEEAFENFDYQFYENDEFTPERCQELENHYWRGITFSAPMYGADMPGSLFDDSCTSWNVAKLPNLLDVLGQQVPGVNTAYLYLGMWKATYAWHLEDVDLYSINYIHFGAPKQWYSISQEDARRFEAAMKDVWPNDAKNCSQFLRHKTYLISPSLLKSKYNITVNKLVHYEGEFVITFPYGYHSGYNLGYNCAESVNFATEDWLEYGRIAKKCDCAADSVWVDVGEIERKLRGEPTPEYYEVTDDEGEVEDGPTDLPSPPASITGKPKHQGQKRKRTAQSQNKVKKIRIRLRPSSAEPCDLCPNEMPFHTLLPTDSGRKAHEICALYTPETTVDEDEHGNSVIKRTSLIDRARLDLKCSYCHLKKGACFQCSERKCTRAFHATCAAPAGVRIESGMAPWYDADGTEYKREVDDFRCRFHRTKRPKTLSSEALEANSLVLNHVKQVSPRNVVQVQFLQGDIFAGVVVENRPQERTLVLDVLPDGDRIEVEWKYVLVNDPNDSKIPKPTPNAKPLPAHLDPFNLENSHPDFGPPATDDPFGAPGALQKWADFKCEMIPRNPFQTKIDFEKPDQIWYYLGRYSTESKAHFTEDLGKPRNNPSGHFLGQMKMANSATSATQLRQVHPNSQRTQNIGLPLTPSQHVPHPAAMPPRPYQYKPRVHSQTAPNSVQHHPNLSSNAQFKPNAGAQTVAPPQASRMATPIISSPYPKLAPSSPLNRCQLPPGLSNPYQASNQQDPSLNNRAITSQSHQSPTSKTPGTAAATTAQTVARSPPETQPDTRSRQELKHEYLKRIPKYPYLRNSYLRRQPVYRSPYAVDGTALRRHSGPMSSPTSSQHVSSANPIYPLHRPGIPEAPSLHSPTAPQKQVSGNMMAQSWQPPQHYSPLNVQQHVKKETVNI